MNVTMTHHRFYGQISRAIVLVAGCATAAWAQPPLQAENLLVAQPTGFKVGHQATQNGNSISEWVPEGETVENWTQMLTVQVFRQSPLDPTVFLQQIGKQWAEACPGSSAKGILSGQVNGYGVSMQVLRCPKNSATGKPETTAFRAIRGNDALYSVQRAFRSNASDKEMNDVMQYLSTVSVCDTRAANHPCPALDTLVPPK
jgi:hypothetical protein